MCMHGLTGVQSDSQNVRRLVKAIVPLFSRCPTMSSSDVRSAMFGLQGRYRSYIYTKLRLLIVGIAVYTTLRLMIVDGYY